MPQSLLKPHLSSISPKLLDSLAAIDSSWNPTPWSRQVFQRELFNPAARVRGVFIKDKLVGYISSHIVLDEAHIVTLAIESTHQRLGLGCLLLSDMIRILSGEGVKTCTLYVRPSNTPALNLYKRFGFKVIGVRKHYYSDNGEDGVVMRCELKREGST